MLSYQTCRTTDAAPVGAVQRVQIEWQLHDWIIVVQRQFLRRTTLELLYLSCSNAWEFLGAVWIPAWPRIVAVRESQSFGEAWTRPSVRGTTNSVGRHQGEIELFC